MSDFIVEPDPANRRGCPHCGAAVTGAFMNIIAWECGTMFACGLSNAPVRSDACQARASARLANAIAEGGGR